MTSFEVFRSTIEKLSGSDGCYTRAYYTYLNMSDFEKVILENYINLNKNYKDSIDVIMDLEG